MPCIFSSLFVTPRIYYQMQNKPNFSVCDSAINYEMTLTMCNAGDSFKRFFFFLWKPNNEPIYILSPDSILFTLCLSLSLLVKRWNKNKIVWFLSWIFRGNRVEGGLQWQNDYRVVLLALSTPLFFCFLWLLCGVKELVCFALFFFGIKSNVFRNVIDLSYKIIIQPWRSI